jgi:hypothetical protein
LPVAQAVSGLLVWHWLFVSQHPLAQLLESQVAADPLLLPPPASRGARHPPRAHRSPVAVQS